jgi:hypothetical protein
VFAIQSWMSESSDSIASGKQPGIFAVGISLLSLAVVSTPGFTVWAEDREEMLIRERL